ncbi:hypothetical protein ACXEHT_004869 [Klebsiella variicola]
MLERLTYYATKYDIQLVISVIDPQRLGAGVHSPSLPEYKMLIRKAESWTEINGIMQDAVSRYGEFNEGYLLATSLPQEVHPDSYATWLVNEMTGDLNKSITGVTHSPIKAMAKLSPSVTYHNGRQRTVRHFQNSFLHALMVFL